MCSVNKKFQEMRKPKPLRQIVCFVCFGAFLGLLGLIVINNISWAYDAFVKNVTALSPDSQAEKFWRNSVEPVTMYIYFFNWTNPEDIYNASVKPKFEEVGPYAFHSFKQKTNVVFNENETVTYSAVVTYFEDPEHSKNLSDMITTLNFVAFAAAHEMKDGAFLQKRLFSLYLSSVSNIYVRKSVRELLFEGFEDPVLSTVKLLPPFLVGSEAPDRFGWLYGTNGTATDNVFNMGIAKDDSYGTVYSWNYQNRTPFFEDQCARVKGTAAELFATNRKRSREYFFHSDLCRSFTLDYEKDEKVKDILGFKYELGPENFDNGTYFPENKCFCNGDCLPTGVMNLSACRQGSPLYFSLPHFYHADPFYLRDIEGLKPQKDKHEFMMIIQPKTGVILNVSAKIQLNVLLQPDSAITMYQNVPKVMFPIFWFQQNFTISDEVAWNIRLLLQLPDVALGISIAAICVGLLLWLVATYTFLRNRLRETEAQKIVPEEFPLRS